LLDIIRTELHEQTKATPNAQKVGEVTGRLGRVVSALAHGLSGSVGIPGAVTVNYDVGQALKSLADSRPNDADLKPESLYVAAFQELQRSFTELGEAGVNRIVVFVDDLDRCLPGNALDVLESIKLFFDLRGFVFVAGLDETVIERAILEKFSALADQPPLPGAQPTAPASGISEQLGHEYTKKIFQIPYLLPGILQAQLLELLGAMCREGGLGNAQTEEICIQVRAHLNYIIVQRRVNPREVKRFINSYTLQTLIQAHLDPNVILALQTLAVGDGWDDAWDALHADPEQFLEALREFRESDDHSAFESRFPGLSRFPAELAAYLSSPLTKPLAEVASLDTYLSSLSSASGVNPWYSESLGQLSKLSRTLKSISAESSVQEIEAAIILARETTRLIRRGDSPSRGTPQIQEAWRRLDRSVTEFATAAHREKDVLPALQGLQERAEICRADLRLLRDSELR
jgi:hypothetical protein